MNSRVSSARPKAALATLIAVAVLGGAYLLYKAADESETVRSDVRSVSQETNVTGDAEEILPANTARPGDRSGESPPPSDGVDMPGSVPAAHPIPMSQDESYETPIDVSGDFPEPLHKVAEMLGAVPPHPNGCKSSFALLSEMAEEDRDELWAFPMERDLERLAAKLLPSDLAVSIGCRQTMCQITAYFHYSRGNNHALNRSLGSLWKSILKGMPDNGFTSIRQFSGADPTRPGHNVYGYMLTGVGYARADEPETCFPGVKEGAQD